MILSAGSNKQDAMCDASDVNQKDTAKDRIDDAKTNEKLPGSKVVY